MSNAFWFGCAWGCTGHGARNTSQGTVTCLSGKAIRILYKHIQGLNLSKADLYGWFIKRNYVHIILHRILSLQGAQSQHYHVF